MDSMGGGREMLKLKGQGIQNDKQQRKATHLAGITFSQMQVYLCLKHTQLSWLNLFERGFRKAEQE